MFKTFCVQSTQNNLSFSLVHGLETGASCHNLNRVESKVECSDWLMANTDIRRTGCWLKGLKIFKLQNFQLLSWVILSLAYGILIVLLLFSLFSYVQFTFISFCRFTFSEALQEQLSRPAVVVPVLIVVWCRERRELKQWWICLEVELHIVTANMTGLLCKARHVLSYPVCFWI